MSLRDEYIPRPGEIDPLADEANASTEHNAGGVQVPNGAPAKERPPLLRLFSPSQLLEYQPPANQNLVGDYHIQRGAPSVLAGPPGCGKSLAVLWLAICGARGAGSWFGLKIHGQFRTLVLQNENGLARLHRNIKQLPSLKDLDQWIRISEPPMMGLAFNNADFRSQLRAAILDFQPHLVIIDPWNACVRDAMEKDFLAAFAQVREVLAECPTQPAVLIVHHLRKPKSDDRHRGRNLQNLLSGSYVLISVARSVMVLQPASDDTEDARVVMTCAKNNDGQLGPATAWERRLGEFAPVENFNFEEFEAGGTRREPKVREEHLRELFQNGGRRLAKNRAVLELGELAGVGRTAAYDALKLDGRFSGLLTMDPDTELISLRPSAEIPNQKRNRSSVCPASERNDPKTSTEGSR